MTYETVGAIQLLSGSNGCDRRIHRFWCAAVCRDRFLRLWRQGGFASQLEHQQATDVTDPRGIGGITTQHRGYATPSGHHGDVLRTLEAEGHGSRDDAGLGGKGPELAALVRGVGDEVAVCRALKHQVACSAQRAAVPVVGIGHTPGLFLLHRIPGQ
ncbi:hypothetical protein D3C80_1010600 [compost metagenome]